VCSVCETITVLLNKLSFLRCISARAAGRNEKSTKCLIPYRILF
jgi:hypothetical protein